MLAEHHRGTDAVVIAAFGDPGLIAARELFEVPITAMAESDRREAMDTYRARRLIEAEIVRLASDNLSRSGLAVLRKHAARQRAAQLSGDRALFIRLVGEFHIVLAGIPATEVLASSVSIRQRS